MLVEDDDHVRRLISAVLRKRGYTVLEARQGQQALESLAAYDGPLHLVVSDMVMPQMSDQCLADQLARRRPHLKVLLMSAYQAGEFQPPLPTDRGRAFLQKPFTPAVLVAKVRELLDQA